MITTDITPPELRADGIAASIAEGWVHDTALDPREITDWPARQARAVVPFDVVDGHPVNPSGPTGRIGRDLGAWGENAAVDPIAVTGTGPDRRVLLIRRGDCGHWAIPGGMVDPGETAAVALVRELREETGLGFAPFAAQVLDQRIVDDPRNTDWAWIASTVALITMRETPPTAGSDATDARWWPFPDLDTLRTAVTADGGQLYAAHEALLALVPAAPVMKHATASVFVFSLFADEWRLGLIEHPRLGRLMIPGGHVEDDESQAAAALREVAEESGLRVRLVDPPMAPLPSGFPHPRVAAPWWITEQSVGPDSHLAAVHVHVDHMYVAIADDRRPVTDPAHPFDWYGPDQIEGLAMLEDSRMLARTLFAAADDPQTALGCTLGAAQR